LFPIPDIEEWTIKIPIYRSRSSTLVSSSDLVDTSEAEAPSQERSLNPNSPQKTLNTSGGAEESNDPKEVSLTLWDFAGTFLGPSIGLFGFSFLTGGAGQEVYYITHEFFLSERSLYLIIFNLSNGLNASYIEYW